MPQIIEGISAMLLGETTWRKSSHSNPNGDCVELAELRAGEVAVRDSRSSGGPVQVYASAQIAGFVQRAKNGDFDETIGRSLVR